LLVCVFYWEFLAGIELSTIILKEKRASVTGIRAFQVCQFLKLGIRFKSNSFHEVMHLEKMKNFIKKGSKSMNIPN